MADKRRVFRPLSAKQLDLAAQITDADREAARRLWRRHARTRFRGLLDARPWPGRVVRPPPI